MRRGEAKQTKEGRHTIWDQAGATCCPRADNERKGSKFDKHHRRERKREKHRGAKKINLPGRDWDCSIHPIHLSIRFPPFRSSSTSNPQGRHVDDDGSLAEGPDGDG